jgi:hypothetical protein
VTKASDNAFPSILITEGTEPSAPSAGKQRLYIDSTTHKLMRTNSSGVETNIEAGGIGAWTDYTPSLTAVTTNPTLGSSTITGRYKAIDSKTYIVRVKLVITTGGAWNAGSGEWKFSLPAGLTAAGSLPCIGSAQVIDSGVGYFAGACQVDSGQTVIWPVTMADDTGNRILAHNKPVTWATNDNVLLTVVVEVA